MVRFGESFELNKIPEWYNHYFKYMLLNKMTEMNHWRLNARQKLANNNLLNDLKEAVASSELVRTVLSLLLQNHTIHTSDCTFY